MYFGLYQVSSRHLQFDAIPYDAPCRGPGLLTMLRAFLRRLFH